MVRGNIRSSGSGSVAIHVSAAHFKRSMIHDDPTMPPEWVTHLGYLLPPYAICDHERPRQHEVAARTIGVGLLYRPEISERPHLKMAHGHALLLLRERAILTRTTATTRRRRMGFWFCCRRGHVPHLMALDGLLMRTRAWSTRPAIAARRFCVQRGLHTAHMEERLAPIASHGFLSSVEES